MKKKTFYILLAVWIMALATFVCVIGCSLNKDDGGSSLPTPPSTEQGSGSGSGGSGNGGSGSGNGGGSNAGDNGGSSGGNSDDNGNNDDYVYGDDGRDWIGG